MPLIRNQFSAAPIYLTSQHTFTDHTSSPALSIYRGRAPTTASDSDRNDPATNVLPPLFSFQVYVTYGVTLATAPTPLAPTLLAHALSALQPSDVVRLDLFFRPGAAAADVVSHYVAEGRARTSHATDATPFRGFAVLLTREGWDAADGSGVDLLFFDPPPDLLASPDRKAILGDDVAEDGVLLVRGVALEEPDGLGMKLRQLAENSRDWRELGQRYDDAVEQGKTEW